MFPAPSLRKIIHISEEALPSVHVPFIFGNVLIILTQQDVRKIEDTRVYNISKVMPNGDLKALNPQEAAVWLQQAPLQQENLLSNHQMLHNLLELLNGTKNSYQELQQHGATLLTHQQYSSGNDGMVHPQPMVIQDASFGNSTMASIEQQLQWNKCENSSPLFPLHYSHGTSTTEINNVEQCVKDREAIATSNCCKTHPQCGTFKKLCNKSTTTTTQELFSNNEALDAREQLKKKKMRSTFFA